MILLCPSIYVTTVFHNTFSGFIPSSMVFCFEVCHTNEMQTGNETNFPLSIVSSGIESRNIWKVLIGILLSNSCHLLSIDFPSFHAIKMQYRVNADTHGGKREEVRHSDSVSALMQILRHGHFSLEVGISRSEISLLATVSCLSLIQQTHGILTSNHSLLQCVVFVFEFFSR